MKASLIAISFTYKMEYISFKIISPMNISLKSLFYQNDERKKRSGFFFILWFLCVSFASFSYPSSKRLTGKIIEMKTNDTRDLPSSILKGFERLSAPINQTAMEYR